ncbi:MAG: amidohydrolase [Clostridia bacterium]|nr:amidohydrolase [Clostridia bacterium]
MKSLFENIKILTPNGVIEGFLGVDGGKIAYIGEVAPAGYESARKIDGRRRALIPGLINTHTHVPMTLLRGYADDYDLDTWLTRHIFPAEAKLDGKCVRAGTVLGIAEMLAGGTTSFSDSYYFCDEIASVAEISGIKASISRTVINFDNEVKFGECDGTREVLDLFNNWHGRDNGRIRIDAIIHAEYTTSESLWRSLGSFAKENGLIMQIHVSESEREHKGCIEKYGKTPIALFEHYGVLDAKTIAAHCVWIDDEDMAIMRKKGVTLAHNPVSNLKLASGIAPIPKAIEQGINVSLGTDGVASNNSHDMFEEMKLAAILHKGRNYNPCAVNAETAFNLATVNGAIAQGRENECGKIAVGMDADLVMLDLDRPHFMPCHNLLSNIVYSARGSDVCMTMVRGKVLYENGEFKTLDVERALFDVENYAISRMF